MILPTVLALINTIINMEQALKIVIGLIFSAEIVFIVRAILIIIGAILFGVVLISMDEIDSEFKTAGMIYPIGNYINLYSWCDWYPTCNSFEYPYLQDFEQSIRYV